MSTDLLPHAGCILHASSSTSSWPGFQDRVRSDMPSSGRELIIPAAIAFRDNVETGMPVVSNTQLTSNHLRLPPLVMLSFSVLFKLAVCVAIIIERRMQHRTLHLMYSIFRLPYLIGRGAVEPIAS